MREMSEVLTTEGATVSNRATSCDSGARIAMDIVGPLPRSHSGNRFILDM